MAKSAQQRFDEYLAECRETSMAVNKLADTSNEYHEGYAYAAGFLGIMLQEAIGELPRARREEMRRRLLSKAEEYQNLLVARMFKGVER